MLQVFSPKVGSTVSMSVSSVSAATAFACDINNHNVLLTNAGTGPVFVRVVQSAGANGTATLADMPVLPNDRVIINAPYQADYLCAVCPTSYTATLYATLGIGG